MELYPSVLDLVAYRQILEEGESLSCPLINPPGSSGEFQTHGHTDASR